MPRRSPAFVLVHVVWATAGRRHVLPAVFDDTLAAILGDRASDVGCTLLSTGCAQDHIHVLVRLAATTALADLVHRMKGGSAHDVNHRQILPARLCWQAGYWAESVGPVDVSPLIEYLRTQRDHHDDSHPLELGRLAPESTSTRSSTRGS